MRIAGIRHIGPYQNIGHAFGGLGRILGGKPPAGAQMIALYHDDPAITPPDQLRSDAAITLPAGAPIPDGLIEQHIPAGRYAVTTHKGSYEGSTGDVGGVEERVVAGQRLSNGASELRGLPQ